MSFRLWNPALVASGEAVCWPPYRQTDFAVFTGSMSKPSPLCCRMLTIMVGWLAFIDLALALLPITIIWNLQMDWHKRVGLSTLMGLGVFAFICAVIKTSKLPELNARADITFITVSLWIWTANETNVIILAASIPTLRPLYLTVFNRPGSEIYRKNDFGHTSRGGKMKTDRTGAPFGTDESTKAVRAVNCEDSRLELGHDRRDSDIPEALELDVSSYPRSKDVDVEHTPAQPPSYVL